MCTIPPKATMKTELPPALLLPTLEKAIFSARLSQCLNNHKQLYVACALYSDSNSGYLPWNAKNASGAPAIMSNYEGTINTYNALGRVWSTGPQ